MADELDPIRVLRALARRPGVGDELHALGVRDLSSFGGPDVYVPPEYESTVRELVDDALGASRAERAPRRPDAPRRGPGRVGTDYPGKGVEDVVRRAHVAELGGEYLGPTLRDRIAAEAKVTTYEADLIFKLIKSGKLADAGREGQLVIDGQLSPTPAFINLHALKTAS